MNNTLQGIVMYTPCKSWEYLSWTKELPSMKQEIDGLYGVKEKTIKRLAFRMGIKPRELDKLICDVSYENC